MNGAAVTLLTKRLVAGVVHPGSAEKNMPPTPIPLPGLSSAGIPPEMAKEFADEAGLPSSDAPKLLAEAIVHLIESECDGGSTIIPNTELAALRKAAADAPDGTRIISLHCACDRTMTDPLLEFALGKDDRVVRDGKAILKALAGRTVDCPHGSVA